MLYNDGGKDWSDKIVRQGTPRIDNPAGSWGVAGEDYSLLVLTGAWPSWRVDFGTAY